VTVPEIVDTQRRNRLYKNYLKKKPFKGKYLSTSLKVNSDTKVVVYKDKPPVIPK
jgi:hypothetical protein